MNVKKRFQMLVAASIFVIVTLGPAQGQQPQLFDRFGDVPLKDEKILLDNVVKRLERDQSSKIYIIVYGKRGGRAGEARGRADRAKYYLIDEKKIDWRRISTNHTCLRSKLEFELWIIPEKVTRVPRCTTR